MEKNEGMDKGRLSFLRSYLLSRVITLVFKKFKIVHLTLYHFNKLNQIKLILKFDALSMG